MISFLVTSRRSAVTAILLGLLGLIAVQAAPLRSDSLKSNRDSGYLSKKTPRWSNKAHFAVPPTLQQECSNRDVAGDVSFENRGLRRTTPKYVAFPSFHTIPADIEPLDAPRGRQKTIGVDIHLGQMRRAGKDIELSAYGRIAVSQEGKTGYKGAFSSVRDCLPPKK